MEDDETPDNLTVASNSYMAEDDHQYDVSQFSTGHRDRKRKRDEPVQDLTEQQHALYGDALLDYFMLSRNDLSTVRPDPPTNFKPDWVIDTEGHTALHWASAMGDVDVVKQLKRFNATLTVRNFRGETPFMRAVHFTNSYEKKTFPQVMRELFSTVDARDASGCTVIHHAAVMKSGRFTSQSCSRYYLDNILNRLQETHDPAFAQQLIDAQDNDGNTAVHLAALNDARKCIRALLGRGAATDIPNKEGIRAEDLIKEINATKSKTRAAPQRSSSPFAPDSNRRMSTFHDALGLEPGPSSTAQPIAPVNNYKAALQAAAPNFKCEAANTVAARITPLVLDKFADLAQCYEDDFREKDEAEREARRALANTQADLSAVRAQLAELEPQLEAEDVAEKVRGEVAFLRAAVAGLVQRQNSILVAEGMGSAAHGQADGTHPDGQMGMELGMELDGEAAPEERLKLAAELHALLAEQRRVEAEYVDALGAVGTGERIDKYRRLLSNCLGPEDMESLDVNLEDLIKMMQEEADVGGAAAGGPPAGAGPLVGGGAGLAYAASAAAAVAGAVGNGDGSGDGVGGAMEIATL
jgi:transcription factor MBP1